MFERLLLISVADVVVVNVVATDAVAVVSISAAVSACVFSVSCSSSLFDLISTSFK